MEANEAKIIAPVPASVPRPLAKLTVAENSSLGENCSTLCGNFSKTPDLQKFDTGNPLEKPISIPPPQTIREAVLSPWWPQYKEAMKVEYDGAVQNGTWTLIPRSDMPPGSNLIRGKWVFDDKRDEKGKILKFKARFVAMGFTQKQGVDFDETFAAVVVMKTFRIMLVTKWNTGT
jgi:hypothetical protein